MCKVSICIPTYNNEVGLKRALESIFIQTFTAYEIVITDDSTNDNIASYVEQLECAHIHYYRNSTRLGSTANWNEAIRKSKGEYIKVLHHDDWFTDENALKTFVSMLETAPEVQFAFSGTCQVSKKETYGRKMEEGHLISLKQDKRNVFLSNKIGSPSAVIFKRDDEFFDENLKWLVDSEFYIRYLLKYPNFSYTEEPLISIGMSEEQLTQSCRDDESVNLFEYSYIYDKYELHEEQRFRKKLIEIYLMYHQNYGKIKKHKISQSEFYKYAIIKKCKEVKLQIKKLWKC